MVPSRGMSQVNKMDSTTVIKWCEVQNSEIKLSIAIDIPGDA